MLSAALSQPIDVKAKLYENIAQALTGNRVVKVSAFCPHLQDVVKHAKNLQLTDDCTRADCHLADTEYALPRHCREDGKPLFLNSYQSLRRSKFAVGALFWQKGRPTLIFLRKRLEYLNIRLPSDFEHHIEERLW